MISVTKPVEETTVEVFRLQLDPDLRVEEWCRDLPSSRRPVALQ